MTLPHTQKQKVGGADEISLLTPEEEEDVVTENVSHPLLRVPFDFIIMILVFDFTPYSHTPNVWQTQPSDDSQQSHWCNWYISLIDNSWNATLSKTLKFRNFTNDFHINSTMMALN